MTPAARYAAAIEVLDDIQSGVPAEQALLAWSRSRRFAGSKDRAAIRDHVFDTLRRRRTCEKRGGGPSGRSLILGLLRETGLDPSTVFTGEGYAPLALSETELQQSESVTLSDAETANLPDDIWALWQSSLGQNALKAAETASYRGPITIRVNNRKIARSELADALSAQDIETIEHPECATALIAIKNERRLATTPHYLDGCFEFQDASSQRAMASLELPSGTRVLDFCAGGGGKSLALGALYDVQLTAFDSNPRRMQDLTARADRSGISVNICESLSELDSAGYDFVLVDAPCSGSGTWRRTPEYKWKIDRQDIEKYAELQFSVLKDAHCFVQDGGELAYATCSVFENENESVAKSFLAEFPKYKLKSQARFDLTQDQDGFYLARFSRT